MRWEYKTPEEKLFVSDGRKIYAWVPADRQVTVSALPADDAPATPILFLLGRGQLARDFTPSLAGAVPGAPADSVALALVPKTPVPDYDRLTLVVDRATLGLRMLIARDGQGGTSTFVFTEPAGERRPAGRAVRVHDSPGSGGCRAGLRSACAASWLPRARRCWWRASRAAPRRRACAPAAPPSALEDFDRAVVEYEKALRAKPDDIRRALSLQRAKLRAADLPRSAGTSPRRHRQAGGSPDRVADCRRAEPGQRRHRRPAARPACAAAGQAGGPQRRQDAPAGADRECRRPAAGRPRTAQGRDAGRLARLPQRRRPRHPHRDRPLRRHQRRLRSAVPRPDRSPSTCARPSLEDALQAVTASTRNFYKISAAKTITVIPDTPAKRREYEDEIIRTFFLSNADVKETLDLLRLVVDNRRLSPVAGRQRHRHQGHAGQDRRRGPGHQRHRQGARRGGHRRRAARGRSLAHARIRPAAGLAGRPALGRDRAATSTPIGAT